VGHTPLVPQTHSKTAVDKSFIQLVSLKISNSAEWTDIKDVFALLDTGSPISFFGKSYFPYLNENNMLKEVLFTALVKHLYLHTYGQKHWLVLFKNKYYKLEAYVIPDLIMPIPLLLGRDAFELLNIKQVSKRNPDEL